MTTSARARYEDWTDEDLVRAAGPERQDFRPEAIALIEAELTRRGIADEQWRRLERAVASEEADRRDELTGVRGWLLIFALMVLGNSLYVLLEWALAGLEDPLVGLFLLPSGLVGVYGLYAFHHLLRRRRSAPRHAARWLIAAFLVPLAYSVVVYGLSGELMLEPLYRAGILIWLVYLAQSKRVAATYGEPSSDSDRESEAGLSGVGNRNRHGLDMH